MHAAQRAAEKAADKAAAEKRKTSGRLLDAGVAKADAKAEEEPLRPSLNTRVHHHNPDGARRTGQAARSARVGRD